jgi:hypothetical protein
VVGTEHNRNTLPCTGPLIVFKPLHAPVTALPCSVPLSHISAPCSLFRCRTSLPPALCSVVAQAAAAVEVAAKEEAIRARERAAIATPGSARRLTTPSTSSGRRMPLGL